MCDWSWIARRRSRSCRWYAAETFLAGLTQTQRDKTLFAVDDLEWRKWMNQSVYVRQGVRFLEMSPEQRDKAFGLLRASLSARRSVFYYRIQSPVILIEFDHQRPVGLRHLIDPGMPNRAHIHTVVRTPNGNDDGKDLLRQHYLQHPHPSR